jgi:hypothetical protein
MPTKFWPSSVLHQPQHWRFYVGLCAATHEQCHDSAITPARSVVEKMNKMSQKRQKKQS